MKFDLKRQSISLLFFFLILSFCSATVSAEIKILDNGDKISWDGSYYDFRDANGEIENIKTDYFYKAQEWFIPWSEYGAGLDSEPVAGTRLAFSSGFNDRDEGEHFPPGVTSSGGSVKASNGLRWIDRTDPWGSPHAWGEIELGAMLKQ
jgi:hypothetical protein